jgi:hypothetical protein
MSMTIYANVRGILILLAMFSVSAAHADISTSKKSYLAGEPIVVMYDGLPGNAQDWITVLPASKPVEGSYDEWYYTAGRKSGQMRFGALNEPGTYEARLFYDWPNGQYTLHGRASFEVVAAPELKLNVTAANTAAAFANDLGRGGVNCDSAQVECPRVDISCENSALSMAGFALASTNIKQAAWEAFSGTYEISKDVIVAMFPELKLAAEIGDVLRLYVDADSKSEFLRSAGKYLAGKGAELPAEGLAEEKLAEWAGQAVYDRIVPPAGERNYVEDSYNDAGCGAKVTVTKMIRRLEGTPSVRVTIGVHADCGYRPQGVPPTRIGKWHVVGGITLDPVISEASNVVKVEFRRSGAANYRVEEAFCSR